MACGLLSGTTATDLAERSQQLLIEDLAADGVIDSTNWAAAARPHRRIKKPSISATIGLLAASCSICLTGQCHKLVSENKVPETRHRSYD